MRTGIAVAASAVSVGAALRARRMARAAKHDDKDRLPTPGVEPRLIQRSRPNVETFSDEQPIRVFLNHEQVMRVLVDRTDQLPRRRASMAWET